METISINNMELKNKKIAFLGYGSMIQGITRKLFDDEIIDKKNCIAVNLSGKSREKGVKFLTDHKEIDNSDIIFVGYKQKDLRAEEVHENMAGIIVISIIAGITEEELQSKFIGAKIVRAMPNRGSVVGKGCTFLKFSRDFTEEEKRTVESLFLASGNAYQVDTTEKIDKGTIFSASMIGVAAFFRDKIHNTLNLSTENHAKSREFFIELENIVTSLTDETNLVVGKAEEVIDQTFLAVEELAKTREYSKIQANVTSPNGTTHAMIENLKQNNIDKILTDIFSENSLNTEKMENFARIIERSCRAGLIRARELAEE